MLGSREKVVSVAIALVLFAAASQLLGFLRSVQSPSYKARAKADTCRAPFILRADGRAEDLVFFRINDGVMGGRSTSQLRSGELEGLVFNGTIRTEGGGFASCRTADGALRGLPLDTTGFNVETIVPAGQTRKWTYKFTLHTADSWAMGTPVWAQDFTPPAGSGTAFLPLADFVPSRQGRPAEGAELSVAAVEGLGFSLSFLTADGKPAPGFGDGDFELEVRSIQVVRDPAAARVASPAGRLFHPAPRLVAYS